MLIVGGGGGGEGIKKIKKFYCCSFFGLREELVVSGNKEGKVIHWTFKLWGENFI